MKAPGPQSLMGGFIFPNPLGLTQGWADIPGGGGVGRNRTLK